MSKHKVATVDEIPPGDSLGVSVNGLNVAVFNVDGEFFALQDRCVHQGGPMHRGKLNPEDCSVYCPWHYHEFSLTDGRNPVSEKERLRVFDVSVEGDDVIVEI